MKTLSDYTPEQVTHFETMRGILAEINLRYIVENVDSTFTPYTKEEIAEYSRYCQIKLREQGAGHPENEN